jgi:hypothetical protein
MAEILVPPAAPTPLDPAASYANRILGQIHSSTEQLVDTQSSVYRTVWESPDATPQEIFDALGVDGERTLLWHQDLVDHLLGTHNGHPLVSMDPAEYTAPLAYTVAPDGKVTITSP